ncbi:hypothetical protein [Acholeplasma granularum]|uniref:hypothetical protein n=1 Tax=Acholeplasma granularum TaxID=264635 RepID=UPI00046FF653|nr:hypothetical protein [Acholeplasma granularum]
MKMLPKDYAKAVGTPFRVEKYKEAKLEMYYLDDRSDYGKFAQRGRFSVWTSDGVDYRLFVDKGYYNAVPDLYKNEVNDIWLDFTNSIYAAQQKMSRSYMFISLIVLGVVLAASFLVQTFWEEQANNVFLISMVILFVGLFYSSSRQQKALRALVSEENQKATALIKETLGAAKFQAILDAQEAYYQEYFKTESTDETEDNVEETSEDVEQLESKEEESQENKDDSKE